MSDAPTTTTFGEPGEPCRSCRAALAADQRYCLECGARRADARLPFMEILRPSGAARGGSVALAGTAHALPATAPAAPLTRSRVNTAFVAGVGCLLLALGIGVLIGRAGHETTKVAAAPAPQVIKVQSSAPAAAPAATPAPDTASTPAKKGKHAASSGGAAHPKATNKALKKLQSLSTDQYQKQSQKLPKTLGTGGKAPPKDNKPAAGGGGFATIG